jgi:hypothetical protein
VVELPIPVQREIRRAAAYLIRQGVTGGEESRSDRDLGAALLQLGKVTEIGGQRIKTIRDKFKTADGKVKKATRPDLVFKRDSDAATRQKFSFNEIMGLKARRDKLGESEFNEQAMRFLQKDAFSRGVRLRRNELESVYNLLSKRDQDSLKGSGSVEAKPGQDPRVWWGGKDANGKDIFRTSATKERGLAVLDMWFRQGGTDAYQGRGGRVRPPMDYDVEHVRPMSKDGKDVPSNWILARGGAQKKRGNAELGGWIDKLPNNKAEYTQWASAERKAKTARETSKAALKALDPSKLTPQFIVSKGSLPLAQIFANEGASGLYLLKGGWASTKEGAGRGTANPPPAPFAKGIGLALLADRTSGLNLGSQLQKIWNNEFVGENGGRQAYDKMVSALKTALPPDQFKLLAPKFAQWEKANASKLS